MGFLQARSLKIWRFHDFPPEADLLQRRMSLWLKPLAEEISNQQIGRSTNNRAWIERHSKRGRSVGVQLNAPTNGKEKQVI
jgi:hypothetical protein